MNPIGIFIGNAIGNRRGGVNWVSYWLTRFPSGLMVTVDSSTQAILTWVNNGTADYDDIRIERSPDGITYAEINTSIIGAMSYSNSGLTANTAYFYRIRYRKGVNYSSYSNVVEIYTYYELLGDYSKTYNLAVVSQYRTLNRKLTGNGWIKCSSVGLTIDEVKSVCLFLNRSITFVNDQITYYVYLTSLIEWTVADSKVHALNYGTDIANGGSFSAGQELRLRRQDDIIYYEYSDDGTTWIILGTASITGDLYAGILFDNFGTAQYIKNVIIGGEWETAFAEVNLGNYSSVTGGFQTYNLYKKLIGDGYIKFNIIGLTEAQADRVVMFLHNSTTFPANNATLKSYIFYYATDHKAHAEMYEPNHSASAGTFATCKYYRLRRQNETIYWEYSADDTTYTVIQSYIWPEVVYAGLMFLVANTQINDVKVCGLKDYGYTTQSSGDMRFLVPRGYVATNKVVMYTHGVGEDEDAPTTDALKIPTINAFIDEGWGVISSLAAGENWGNQASLDDYEALITWAKTIHAFTDLDIFTQSMGGCSGLQLFMNSSQYGKFIGIYPVCSLLDMFTEGTYKAAIKTAFGFVDDADYATATAGHDPLLESGALLNDRKMLLVASEADTTVVKDNNTDAFNTTFSGNADITVVTATGNHGDPSHFNIVRDTAFILK